MGKQIAVFIREWRTERGLSMSALATYAGVNQATISRWESGQRLPSVPELEAVLTTLRVSPAQRLEAMQAINAPRAIERVRDIAGEELPLGGDLLRVMRSRKGWTQAQVAASVGVRQATIARWERSEEWPIAERLHTLCFHLGASAQETAALMRGPGNALHLTAVIETPEQCDQILRRIHAQSELRDLGYLALEAQLWQRTRRDPRFYALLYTTWQHHFSTLMVGRRYAEAGVYVERVLDASQRLPACFQMPWNGSVKPVSAPEIHAGALIAQATILSETNRRGGLQAMRRKMLAAAESVTATPFRAWLTSEAALLLAKESPGEAAAELSRQAAEFASDGDSQWDGLFRRRDHALALLHIGQPERALAALDSCAELLACHPDSAVRHHLLTAECLLALDCAARAHDSLQLAGEILNAHHDIDYLHPLMEPLAARL